MIYAPLGLAVSAAFAGAAFYINWAEQPARLALDDAAMLKEWKPAYARGYLMQAPLAVLAGILGIAAYAFEGSLAAVIGGVLLLLNWPYTLLVIMPTNKRLEAIRADLADPEIRLLIVRWGRLHAVRTLLGIGGSAMFLAAVLT